MSEHRSRRVERLGRTLKEWAECPLLGTDPRRTAVSLAVLTVFACLTVVSTVAKDDLAGLRLATQTTAFDSLSSVVIVAGTALVLVGPFVYAAYNGGPALAFTIPLVPVALGELVAGRYVLDLDGAVALTTGVAGAAVALYLADVRRTGAHTPWNAPARGGERLFVLAVAVAGGVLVGRFVAATPDRVVSTYLQFGFLWVLPLAVGAGYCLPVVREMISNATCWRFDD